MAKAAKKAVKPKKERADQYNDKLTVKGTFLDLMKETVKDAKAKAAKKAS